MKVYVGNLPYSIDDARLEQIFREFGTVTSASVVADKPSGRSKGFGFVEMPDDDARKAILALNRTQLDGRTIWVNEARVRA